jgi:hypothetical protein
MCVSISTFLFFVSLLQKMHPSPYIVTGPGYKRYFGHYPETNYHPFELNVYSSQNDKYCQSRVGWPSMPTHVPIEPHNHDVLLGRGGRNNQHSGNDILRQFGRLQGENYRVASKKGKSAISRLLVRQMRELNPPARCVTFLLTISFIRGTTVVLTDIYRAGF